MEILFNDERYGIGVNDGVVSIKLRGEGVILRIKRSRGKLRVSVHEGKIGAKKAPVSFKDARR